MYEPIAKNSITERVAFTGIASEDHQTDVGWEPVSERKAHAPRKLQESGSASPDPDRRPSRPNLYAIR